MTRLIHLNGPPGIGKSTLAQRFTDDHPGTLNCDIDVLRTMVGGWRDNFDDAGAWIRTAALALIGTYLAGGHDVVLPQLIARHTELERFRACAEGAGAAFVEIVLLDHEDAAVQRFHRRGSTTALPAAPAGGTPDPPPSGDEPDPWHEQIRAIVATQGGADALKRSHRALTQLATSWPQARIVLSADGEIEHTYREVLLALAV